jgi:hypothetical protein
VEPNNIENFLLGWGNLACTIFFHKSYGLPTWTNITKTSAFSLHEVSKIVTIVILNDRPNRRWKVKNWLNVEMSAGNQFHTQIQTLANWNSIWLCVGSNTKLSVSEIHFIIMRYRRYKDTNSHKNGSLSRNTSGCTSRMLSALSQTILARLVLRISCNCSENQEEYNAT